MPKSLHYALVICTYQRPASLRRLLGSVAQQTRAFDSIWVIDASPQADHDLVGAFPQLPLHYHHALPHERGLTRQRNVGINQAIPTSDFLFFLDDDVALAPDYVAHIDNVFTQYPQAIGVGGYIVNDVAWRSTSTATRTNSTCYQADSWERNLPLRWRWRQMLGLYPKAPAGRYDASGHPLGLGFIPPSGRVYPVDFIMGGASSFRAQVFAKQRFSTYFEGYGLYEDMAFCLEVRKKGQIYLSTQARLSHFHDPNGRPPGFAYGQMVMRNGWLIWKSVYPNPTLNQMLRWHGTSWFLAFCLWAKPTQKSSWQQWAGRMWGWLSLYVQPPQWPTP